MAPLEDVRATLASLDNYEFPTEKYESVSFHDPSLVAKYTAHRDEYLRRRVLSTLLQHVTQEGNFDGSKFADVPDLPDMRELEEARQQQEQLALETAQEVQQKMQALRRNYQTFLQRKQQVKDMMKEMKDEGVGDESMIIDEDDTIDPQVLQQQEEKLTQLQLRKQELLQKIEVSQKKTIQLEKNNQDKRQELLQKGITDVSQAHANKLQESISQNQQEFKSLQDIKDFYDSIRVVTEEIAGIQIVSIQPVDDEKGMLVNIKLQNKFDLQVRMTNNSQGVLRVAAASWTSDTTLRSEPRADGSVAVTLTLPDCQDLCEITQTMNTGDDLRFVAHEAMHRVMVHQARVQDLARLQDHALVKVGASYHYANSYGGEDQEIVCSLNEQITCVLRLTPDCPLVPGSVRVDHMVGLGGWTPEAVQNLQERVRANEYTSTVEVLTRIMACLEAMAEEGYEIPSTPHLPKRNE